MIENVTIIDKNGNGILAEGIAYIQFLSTNKRYVLYTLNEKVENDLTKMYVAEVSDTPGILDKIPDEEWANVRTSLNGISHGEINSDIKYLKMSDTNFYIGIPKKLAIKADVKQAFKDRQLSGVLEANTIQDGNVPAVGPTTNFFNQDAVGNAPSATPISTENNEVVNIFNNPIQPAAVPQAPVINETVQTIQTGDVQPVQTIQQPVVQQVVPNNAQLINPLPNTVQNPGIIEQSTLSTGTETIQNSNNISTQTNNLNQEFIQEAEPIKIDTIAETAIIEPNSDFVTKEEAIKALDVLNKYFKNSSGDINSLILESKVNVKNEEANMSYEQPASQINNINEAPANDISNMENASLNSLEIVNPLPTNENMINNNVTPVDNTMNNYLVQDNSVENIVVPEEIPHIEATPIDIGLKRTINQPINNGEQVVSPQPEYIYTGIGANNLEQTSDFNQQSNNFGQINTGISEPSNNEMNNATYTSVTDMEIPAVPPIDLSAISEVPSQEQNNSYVATGNSAAVNMGVEETPQVQIPVVLPDSYVNQTPQNGDSILGPGSLPDVNTTN